MHTGKKPEQSAPFFSNRGENFDLLRIETSKSERTKKIITNIWTDEAFYVHSTNQQFLTAINDHSLVEFVGTQSQYLKASKTESGIGQKLVHPAKTRMKSYVEKNSGGRNLPSSLLRFDKPKVVSVVRKIGLGFIVRGALAANPLPTKMKVVPNMSSLVGLLFLFVCMILATFFNVHQCFTLTLFREYGSKSRPWTRSTSARDLRSQCASLC